MATVNIEVPAPETISVEVDSSTIVAVEIGGTMGPQGLKGDQGDQGPQGIQGVPGNDGATGATGAQGIQGIQGDPGEKGDQGDPGPAVSSWNDLTDKPSTFPPIIGSGSGDAVAGNDARLTDARTPTAHTHPLAELTGVTPAAIGAEPAKGADDNFVSDAEKTLLGDAATKTGAETLTNKTLTNPTVNNYTEGVVAIGNSGTSQTIALTSGTFQTVTLTGNCTFTMPTATAGKSFVLKVLTEEGGFTAAFTGVKWSGGAAPTITVAASKYDLISFIADGSAWSGSAIQNFTA